MDTYLSSIRSRLDSETSANVILVTGNESAGKKQSANKSSIVVPYINIPKIDLALRSDSEYVLETCGINHNHLFFRDQLSVFEQLASKNQLSLFLVDHNKIALSMTSLNSAKVEGLVDHHVDECLYKDTANPRRVEAVGSCASIVADEYFQSTIDNDKSDSSWTQGIARLLLGPILIDTMDLDPERKKVKPLDVAMANLIFPYTGWKSMHHLYHQINKARQDTSKLSYYDLLRKDYKEWTVTQQNSKNEVKVGISSVVGLMDKYIKRDGKDIIHQAIDKWAKNQEVDILFVMLSEDLGEEHGGFQRQLIVNPISSSVKDISSQLEKDSSLELERSLIMDTDGFLKSTGGAYLQHNCAYSRKQVWPIIEKLLAHL
ncbi:Exopolyphosphatase [Entomortierella beljakovae]|nr:Exopolyphosphatase [Entomortierella beljakovae]